MHLFTLITMVLTLKHTLAVQRTSHDHYSVHFISVAFGIDLSEETEPLIFHNDKGMVEKTLG